MKKHLTLFFAALLSFCMVSCHDDDENTGNTGNNGTNQEQNDPNPLGINYAAIDFMLNTWTLTAIQCEDLTGTAKANLEAAIKNKEAIIAPFGVSGTTNYKGWGINMSVAAQSQFTFFTESYTITNGKHLLSASTAANNTPYTGEIKFRSDENLIYVTWEGTMPNGKKASFACTQKAAPFANL